MAEKMPKWMEEDQDSGYCDTEVALADADRVTDENIDEVVLTASAKTEEEKQKLREQYAQLFPEKALGVGEGKIE